MDELEYKLLEEKLSYELYFASKIKTQKILFVVINDEVLELLKSYHKDKFLNVSFISAYNLGTIEKSRLNELNFDWLIIDDFSNLVYSGNVLFNLDLILKQNPDLKVFKISREKIQEEARRERENLECIASKSNLEDVANNNQRTMQTDWDKMYNLALTYYNFHHTLKMPKNFTTLDGYTPSNSKSALNLDLWLNLQFALLRNGNLSYYQKKKLEELNYESKNLKSSNQERICYENGIDYELNKDIIEKNSCELFLAKINFLKDNGLPLVNLSGRLHPIFEMDTLKIDEKSIKKKT